MHLIKCTSEQLSSYIKSFISILNFAPRNLSFFLLEIEFPLALFSFCDCQMLIISFEEVYYTQESKNWLNSSLFLLLKPFILYSTFYAECTIINDSFDIFGIIRVSFFEYVKLIFYSNLSSEEFPKAQLSSNKSKTLTGAFSSISIIC